VFETNFGLVHTPDRTKANMRAYMWDKMKDLRLHGAIEADEKMAADPAGPGDHINRSNLFCWCWSRRPTCRSAARTRPMTETPSR
jgi:hypothetical protein